MFALLAALAMAQPPETVVVQGARPAASADICLRIGEAKAKEWLEARVLRERTDTFADGATRISEFIFTEDSVYVRDRGVWKSAQTTRAQRRADTPANVVKRMMLADCSQGYDVDGAMEYSFSQGDDGAGEIWISDTTGLPLRMEIRKRAARPGDAVAISFRYAYGADVHVPGEAERVALERRERAQAWLAALQTGRPVW